LGQQWAGGAGGGKDSSLFLSFLVGKRRRWRWAARFSSSSSRGLLVFADRKTKRNGRQKEQEIDHEEIVEEEAGIKGRDRRTRNGIKQGERGVSSHGGIE